MTKSKWPKYYYPAPDEKWWNAEVEKIMPYLDGKGIDIGCGGRSPLKGITRLDIDPKKKPDIVASGDDIPVKDNEYDYLVAIHAFEHFPDPIKTLNEWVRVVRKNGYICIVHPDVRYSKKQKPPEKNPLLRKDPYFKHYFEYTQEAFVRWIGKRTGLGFVVVDYGPACIGLSFYVILKVTKGGDN